MDKRNFYIGTIELVKHKRRERVRMNLRLKKKKNKKYCKTLWHELYACIDEAMDYDIGKRRKA